jgi:hypothetical protein
MLRTVDDDANSVATYVDGSAYVAGFTNGSIDGQPNQGADGFVTKLVDT